MLRDRATIWPRASARSPGVADVFIPQDIDYPALQLDIDRTRAGQLGLDQNEVVGNVITALTSNQMIAPSYWIDPKSGNDYMLTVQYPENQVRSLQRPARHSRCAAPGRQQSDAARRHQPHPAASARPPRWTTTSSAASSTSTCGLPDEDLGRIANAIDGIIAATEVARGRGGQPARHGAGHARLVPQLRARPAAWRVVLLYLILVAQFRSFIDPFLILLAVPTGLDGRARSRC